LWGTCLYDWLAIELVFVPAQLRGQRVGSRLLKQAEAAAQARGCIGAWLDTFSFQAREFYEKLGYSAAGEIADHPRGGARYFLAKRFS
jgi:GNAT superfamily N-acetyltransferase